MKSILYKIKFWLNNARLYTGPITWLSWLVIFTYGLKHGGNFFLGLLTFPAIALAHLATNLTDDYFDYKDICEETKECKCKYLKNGSATLCELRNVIFIFLLIAAAIGVFLFFKCGIYVLFFALLALFVILSYPKLSSKGFGDFAVITAYGPLMFGGVYYVMTKTFSLGVIFLSFACAIIVNTILYAHMLMDFDQDVCVNKVTLCTKQKSKDKALKILIYFYVCAYICMIILGKFYLLTLITIPLVIKLYKSLEIYNNDNKILPTVSIINYPLNLNKNIPNAPFFYRFFMAINISTLFMLLCCLGIILD
ncbi:prenyltransferase [bacterium]|nr:prenyltransferase [bacterium]